MENHGEYPGAGFNGTNLELTSMGHKAHITNFKKAPLLARVFIKVIKIFQLES